MGFIINKKISLRITQKTQKTNPYVTTGERSVYTTANQAYGLKILKCFYLRLLRYSRIIFFVFMSLFPFAVKIKTQLLQLQHKPVHHVAQAHQRNQTSLYKPRWFVL